MHGGGQRRQASVGSGEVAVRIEEQALGVSRDADDEGHAEGVGALKVAAERGEVVQRSAVLDRFGHPTFVKLRGEEVDLGDDRA